MSAAAGSPKAKDMARAMLSAPTSGAAGEPGSLSAWWRYWTTNGHMMIQTRDRLRRRYAVGQVASDILRNRPKRATKERAKIGPDGHVERVQLGGVAFTAAYVRIVEESFPGVAWHVPKDYKHWPAHAVLRGETVAVVMGRRP